MLRITCCTSITEYPSGGPNRSSPGGKGALDVAGIATRGNYTAALHVIRWKFA